MLLAACFSPGPQLTGSTGGPSSDATTTAAPTTSTTTTTTTSEPTGSTTSAETATSPTQSTGDPCDACATPTPICNSSQQCVGCEQLSNSALSCAEMDPGKPLCDAGDKGGTGSCVECLSSADCETESQECAPDSHACIPRASCTRHGECESGACEFDVGTCFPVDSRRWYVDDAPRCDALQCTEAAPCCEISQAFERIANAGGRYHIVQVAAGKYTEQVTLAKDATRVAVLGESGTKLELAIAGKPLILLGDVGAMPPAMLDSKLFLSRLELTGVGTVGLSCFNSLFLGLDELLIAELTGTALFTSGCRLSARRSKFIGNSGGVWVSGGGEARLENSIVAGATVNPALRVELEGTLELVYSTVGRQTELQGGLLNCVVKNDVQPGAVTIRNSAVLAGFANAAVDCVATISTTTSVITSAELDVGAGNKQIAPAQVSVPFIDWANNNLRISLTGDVLADVAVWKTGDPPTDIDGELRAGEDGAKEVAGADLPVL